METTKKKTIEDIQRKITKETKYVTTKYQQNIKEGSNKEKKEQDNYNI